MDPNLLDEDFIGGGPSLRTARFAGFGIRLGATLVDLLALSPIWGLGVYNAIELKSIPLMLGLTLLQAAYKPYMEWKEKATLGKMAMKIEVVNENLEQITGEQAFHRYALWLGSIIIATAINLQVYNSPEFLEVTDFREIGLLSQGTMLATINSVYSIFFLIAVGSLVVDQRKQGLHDKLARTYCVYKRR